jgi:hypothetical protein
MTFAKSSANVPSEKRKIHRDPLSDARIFLLGKRGYGHYGNTGRDNPMRYSGTICALRRYFPIENHTKNWKRSCSIISR